MEPPVGGSTALHQRLFRRFIFPYLLQGRGVRYLQIEQIISLRGETVSHGHDLLGECQGFAAFAQLQPDPDPLPLHLKPEGGAPPAQ